MKLNDVPFNIDLLVPSETELKTLQKVTSLDIFEPSSKNFHPNGLFSTEIFGKSGTEHRNRLFAYIDVKVPIIHPVIYKALKELKELYEGIMSQTKYAIWNDEIKDFEAASPVDGSTGMHFFLKHWKDIVFEERAGAKRSFNIRLVKEYQSKATTTKILVLPAGLRDYQIDESGKPEEGEVNVFYRTILAVSNLINLEAYKISPESIDGSRYTIQRTFNELYAYFRNLIEGKNKLIQGGWAARKIFNSTRNVISTINNQAKTANDPTTIKYNETAIGLFQYAKSIIPLSIHHLRETFLSKVFPGPNSPAVLVNTKTLKKEMVHVKPEHYDEWMSMEGLEHVLNRFGERDLRHEYLKIENHYLGLIYKGPDNTYRFMHDIDELPEDRSKEHVTPITFAELIYLSLYKDSNEIPAYVSRYPIAGYGSVYPSICHLKTTIPSEVRTELLDDWRLGDSKAINFPITGASFFDTMAPHKSHLARLAGDFDGDMMSFITVITEEAKAEVKDKLNSAGFYVDGNGKMFFSAETETIKYAMAYMMQ